MEALRSAPVRLPAGRLKLSTSPSATGSVPVKNTMGMSDVADLALAMAEEVQFFLPSEPMQGLARLIDGAADKKRRRPGVGCRYPSWQSPHPFS